VNRISSPCRRSPELSGFTGDSGMRNAAYVGDTASDGKAAILAGIAFVYAAWGFGKPEGKPNTVHSFPQLLDHIEGKADKNVATEALRLSEISHRQGPCH